MKGIIAFSWLGLKQICRQKLFTAIVFLFILYLGFCLFMGELSAGHADKVLRDMGLAGIEVSLVVLSVFGLSFDLARDKSSRIRDIYLLHLSRSVYAGAKILSYILAAFLYLAISGAALSLLLILYKSFTAAVFFGLYSLLLKTALIVAFASLFVSVFSSPLLAASATFFVYVAAEFLPSAWEIMSRTPHSYERSIIYILYAVFPNFSGLDFHYLAVWGNIPSWQQVGEATIYALAYLVCVYLINITVLEKKEL